MRNSKYHMKVWGIQYILTTLINPFFLRKSLAHRTASVTTGVIMNLKLPAILTNADVSTVSTGFTVDDTVSNIGLLRERRIGFKITRIKSLLLRALRTL